MILRQAQDEPLRQAQDERSSEERLANDPTSELWGEHRARYRFAAQFLPGGRVLDMACGSGFGLEMLGDAGTCPVGVDYDGDALGAVRHRLRAVRLVRADASMLPFPNGSFNAVVSFETLEHVPDAAAMVAELRRVLKPGGPLVLSTPNRSFGPPERHTGNKFHIREFTADEVRDLLQTHFAEVRLFGQRPSAAYRYVPFLMIQAEYSAAALAWKALLRLPYRTRNTLAVALSGRPFYPSETDYCFDAEATDNAHALVAVAQ